MAYWCVSIQTQSKITELAVVMHKKKKKKQFQSLSVQITPWVKSLHTELSVALDLIYQPQRRKKCPNRTLVLQSKFMTAKTFETSHLCPTRVKHISERLLFDVLRQQRYLKSTFEEAPCDRTPGAAKT